MLRERIAGLHRAIVVANNDPEGLMRVRVQIPALLGETVSNWAWPSIPNVAGQSPPDVQSPVWVAFEDGDVDRPVWMGTWLPTRFPNAPQTPQNYILSGGINVFPTASAVAFAMQTVGDTVSRFEARASGQLRWGGGGAAADVILDRTAPGQLRLSGIRTAGANENTFVLSDPVTGVQAAGFGQRILWRSNNEASLAALAFEVGATGTNNETQIALYTQNVAGSLLRNWLLGSRGDVFHSVSSASAVGYILRAAASQTTDLQQWQNSAGTVLAKLTSVGWLQAERAVVARGVGGGVSFDPVYPIDHGHIYVDAITKLRHHAYYGHVFTTGGGVDIQQWQDPAGNVLAAVPAGGGFNASMAGAGAIRANYDTGFIVGGISLTGYGVLFQSDNGLNNVLNVRGRPSQSADLQQWQNSAGTALAKIGATGELYTPSLYNAGYAAGHTFVNLTSSSTYFFAGGATNVPIVVRGAASQTADLQQWQNSAGDVPALVTSAGRIVAVEGLFVRPGAEDFAVFASTTVASKVPILAKGAASQTANLQEWQDSAGAVRAYVSGIESRLHAAGRVTSPLAYFDSLYSYNGTAPVTVFASSGSVTVFAVRAAAAQNADLQQWQNSTGGVLAKVGATGELYVPYLYNAGYASGHTFINLTSASTFFFAGAVGNIPIVVRGAAAQTADLQQWQNSAGAALAKVTSGGVLDLSGATLRRQGQIRFPVGAGLESVNTVTPGYGNARIVQYQTANFGMSMNAWFDGTAWQRDDTTYPSSVMVVSGGPGFYFYTAAAAAGNVNFIERLRIVPGVPIYANGTITSYGISISTGGTWNNYVNQGAGSSVSMSYDTTGSVGWLACLSEGVSWRYMKYQAYAHYFYGNNAPGDSTGATMSIHSDVVVFRKREVSSSNWSTQPVRAWTSGSANQLTGFSAHNQYLGYAPIFGCDPAGVGEIWQAKNNMNSGFIPHEASGYFTTSSADSKRDVRTLPSTDIWTKLKKVRPVVFKRLPTVHTDGRQRPSVVVKFDDSDRLGFMVEEMALLFPEAVKFEADDTPTSIDYGSLVPVLVSAIQQLEARLAVLERRP